MDWGERLSRQSGRAHRRPRSIAYLCIPVVPPPAALLPTSWHSPPLERPTMSILLHLVGRILRIIVRACRQGSARPPRTKSLSLGALNRPSGSGAGPGRCELAWTSPILASRKGIPPPLSATIRRGGGVGDPASTKGTHPRLSTPASGGAHDTRRASAITRGPVPRVIAAGGRGRVTDLCRG